MEQFAVFAFKFALWAVAALSVLGMTVVPLSLFADMLWKQHKAKKSRR